MNAKHLIPPAAGGGNSGNNNTNSLGRTGGQRTLQRVPSHESLATHPLLSPHSATFAPSPAAAAAPASTAYVPYTPRNQRPSTAPAPPEAQHKLQLVSLKSVAQGELGLDPASVGWHLLERIITMPDWAPPRSKPVLLLPVTRSESRTEVEVRDHVALQRGDGWLQTVSGLLGRIDEQTLTFVRAFPGAAHPANAVICPAHPKFTCAKYSDALPLPPTPTAPPPLPPRPAPAPRTGLSLGGLSLFGRRAPSPAPPRPASPAGSITSTQSASAISPISAPASATAPASPSSAPATQVPAYTLSRPIVRAEIIRQLAAGARQEVAAAFSDGKPDPRWTWLSERISAFVVEELDAAEVDEHAEEHARADALADRVRTLYDQLEDDIRAFLVAERTAPARGKRRRWGRDKEKAAESDPEKAATDESKKSSDDPRKSTDSDASAADESAEDADDEACARALVATERAVCRVLWDRMFVLDTAQDDAFASRVAALHMAELSLGELGVDVTGGRDETEAARAAVEDGVEGVVGKVGQVLAGLDKVYTPSEKCQIFVEAHRVIVDGLSKLPPLRLKPEVEESQEKEKKAQELELEALPGAKSTDSKPTETALGDANAGKLTITTDTSAAMTDANVLVTSPDGIEIDAHKQLAAPSTPAVPPAPTSTAVSSDLLLPVLIYALVRANPPRLPSHLAHVQRFQCAAALPGEAAFCAVSVLAAVQYIETAAGDGKRTADDGTGAVPPSPLPPVPTSPLPGGALRRVLSGATDVFGIIRGTLQGEEGVAVKDDQDKPATQDAEKADDAADADKEGKEAKDVPLSTSPWNAGLSALLRRDTGGGGLLGTGSGFFSREGVFGRSGSTKEEELADVPSRPGSAYPGSRPTSRPGSIYTAYGDDSGEEDEEDEEEDDEDDDEEGSEESGDEGGPARSIRSFGSMMSSRRRKASKSSANSRGGSSAVRKSLSDRLASVSGGIANVGSLAASFQGSPPPSRRSSLLPKVVQPPSPRAESPIPPSLRAGSPSSLRPTSPGPASPSTLRLAPPRARFLTCAPDDLRLAEVAELLQDYRRIVKGVRSVGGFVGE